MRPYREWPLESRSDRDERDMTKPTRANILLVDDDALMRSLVSAGLEKCGMAMQAKGDGRTALEALQSGTFDLVLLDVHMPEMDGFAVLREIRQGEATRSLPVIMLTGDNDSKSIEAAFELGATDFITKPINLRLLEQRIRYAMAGHAREKRLEQLQAEQSSACQIARLGFWRAQQGKLLLSWSSAAPELLGRPSGLPETIDQLASETAPEDRPRLLHAFANAADHGEPFDLEVRLGIDNGHQIIRFNSPGSKDGQDLIGAFQNVTALRDLESQALYLAEHDELTGLPKQRLFSRLLENLLSQNKNQQVMMLAVSIDPFLKLTEYFGKAGNQDGLLTIASRLLGLYQGHAVSGRLDDGTFGFSLTVTPTDADVILQSIAHSLGEPVRIGERELAVNLAIGAASYPVDASQASDLIRASKLACRTVQRLPNGGLAKYNELQNRAYGSRLILESDLRAAFEQKQFFLVFQAQQDIQSGQIVGAEALLRWQHPKKGLVSPADFVPVLEETGLIEQVGAWVLEEAIRSAAELQRAGQTLRIGVNLSAIQLLDSALPETLAKSCSVHHLPHQCLDLEITEGMAMSDPARTREHLNRLKSLDFGISIDDFGTGHSSLAYITDFPIDTIKIDRSFVQGVTDGRKQRAIVTSITALCRDLDLNTVAEGVETMRQKDYVDALGVKVIQGFLLSRPIPMNELRAFLANQPKTQRANS